jgi:hypothetical protein
MRDRKSALMWAVAWWFGRRWLKRRAAMAVAALAAGFVVWRRLAGGGEPEWVGPETVAPSVATVPDTVPT